MRIDCPVLHVYIPIWEEDPHASPNPYVATLTDSISRQFGVEFTFSKEFLWQAECEQFDIIHFMWPHLYSFVCSSYEFKERVSYLKRKGIKIVSTCHNIVPHSEDKTECDFYDIVYSLSNTIIHLGEYSKSILESRFPEAYHICIPHHIYDSLYNAFPSATDSFSHLHIHKFWKHYILCLGAFRNQDEKRLIRNLSKKLLKNRIAIIAPTLRYQPKYAFKKSAIISLIKWWGQKLLFPNLIISGKRITDNEIPFYFGISDALIIQRIKITNSGNLPLAFFFGKAVIGPNIGNVGEILQASSNAVFDPYDIDSVYQAVLQAINNNGIGKHNQNFAISQWSTDIIASKTYEMYKSMCDIS